MHLPRLSASRQAWLRRPVVLAPITTFALAGLLGTGLLVANAVGTGPVTEVGATASPDPSSAPAGGSTTSGGDDNAAVAVNTKDGSTVYAVRLKVVFTGADVVDSTNVAVAAASCTDCQTVAIALEGVVITGDAEVIAPENVALAINSGCTNCQTLAYAYQNVQTTDGKVRLTGAGRKQIADLRKQLNQLRTSGLDLAAVRAEVNRIAGEFASVLRTELVAKGKPQASPSPSVEGGSPVATASPSADSGRTASPAAAGPSAGTTPSASAQPTTSAQPRTSAQPSVSASPAA